MTSEVLLPQSAGVQLPAFGLAIVVTAVVVGLLAWVWSGARSGDAAYRRGYLKGYDSGHDSGFIHGFREAGVLDRLVALDTLEHDAEFQREALMRRYRGAIEAWIAEGRKWA